MSSHEFTAVNSLGPWTHGSKLMWVPLYLPMLNHMWFQHLVKVFPSPGRCFLSYRCYKHYIHVNMCPYMSFRTYCVSGLHSWNFSSLHAYPFESPTSGEFIPRNESFNYFNCFKGGIQVEHNDNCVNVCYKHLSKCYLCYL